MSRHRYILLLTGFFLGFYAARLWAQTPVEISVLSPANVSVFDIDAGLPISCTVDGIIDRTGRLWINPCYSQEEHRTVNFYMYDGTQSAFIEWGSLNADIKGQAALSGITDSGELYGFFRSTGTSFFFDPETRKARFYSLDTAGAFIATLQKNETYGIILYALSPTNHLVYRLDQEGAHLMATIPRMDANTRDDSHSMSNNVLLTETELWISDYGTSENVLKTGIIPNFGSVIRIQLSTGRYQKYSLNDFYRKVPPPIKADLSRIITRDQQGAILVYLRAWDQYFTIDPSLGVPRPYEPFSKKYLSTRPKATLPFDKTVRIDRDQAGNMLFFYTYGPIVWAVLKDKEGRLYDYAPVLDAARASSRHDKANIFNIKGRDFKRQAYIFMSSGLAVVDMKLSGSIKLCMSGFGARTISEVTPGKYITILEKGKALQWFNPDIYLSDTIHHNFHLDCNPNQYDIRRLADIQKGPDGSFWVPAGQKLLRFQASGACTTYQVGVEFMKFAFVDPSRIVLLAEDRLFVYHIPSQKLVPQMANGSPIKFNGVVNQIYVSRTGMVWVACLGGLYRINLNTGEHRLIGQAEGFQDNRIMCIDEDEEGRLWIGTYRGGLHIYDPGAGVVSIIDKKKGLSNNTVVGILTDKSGVRWLSTYEGITLVSAKGEVLARLFREDGLCSNEFNRYSYCKGTNGDLLFGSINGINIIQPEGIKSHLVGAAPVRIFLNQVSYFDANKDSLITQTQWPTHCETINLPAGHRSISLYYALTSLVRREENSFSYKLEGPDIEDSKNWIYIGTNNELSLQDLPPGEYNILIRGCDYRGNWTPEPLVIPIRAAEFFYRQTWFIALCLCSLISLILIWMYRQRIERKRLEKELLERTNEIMRTRDQLVVQEKLASLGQLTAGIAHEIKNPLNFVNNFAADSSRLADRLIGELEQAKDGMDADRFKRLMRYLQDMKQNALDIQSSGNTADRIVRSMMDHARETSETMELLDLNHLIEENLHLVVSGFRANHPNFNITVEESYDRNIRQVYGSSLNLSRAFINILDNACYALYEKQQQDKYFKPLLHIQTKAHDTQVEISIRDNGPGILPDTLKSIFTPFFTTKPTGKGNTGLGLSICHDIIVTEHSGQIVVESEPGVFTEFILNIPISIDNMTPSDPS